MDIRRPQMYQAMTSHSNPVKMSPAAPVDDTFWSKKEIGGCLGLGATSIDNLVKRPNFPASYRFPTEGNGSQPRWKAKDVLAWAESFRGREAAKK